MSFQRALDFTLHWEGGYVHDPADPGGATNYGVTQAVYDAHRREHSKPLRSVREITPEELTAIYSGRYWTAALCPRWERVWPELAVVQFDAAVHSGPEQATKFLQAALGVVVDGVVGPLTEAAVRHAISTGNGTQLLRNTINAREGFLARLVERKPSMAKFWRGWLRRLNGLRREVGLL